MSTNYPQNWFGDTVAQLDPTPSMTTFSIKVSKADNGWLVTCNTVTFVVQGDEDLGQMISAAIVTNRLTDDGTHYKNKKEEYIRFAAQNQAGMLNQAIGGNAAMNSGLSGYANSGLLGQQVVTSTAVAPPDESFLRQFLNYVKAKP